MGYRASDFCWASPLHPSEEFLQCEVGARKAPPRELERYYRGLNT